MNTPSHFILNLTVLGKKDSKTYFWALLIGALLPDVPMFIFYFVESFILQTPNREIWDVAYFQPHWQDFIDSFNSIPIIALVLGLAYRLSNKFLMLICLSMLLHIAFDLPLHHDDGHRHFFPFFQWRFESPISYWDPRHFGGVISALEGLAVFICCVFLFLRHSNKWPRAGIVLMAAFQLVELTFTARFYL